MYIHVYNTETQQRHFIHQEEDILKYIAQIHGSQPMGCKPFRGQKTFYRGHLKQSEDIDIYIMISNSSKITGMK